MKKLLSAVLAILIIMSTATFTGSVFSASAETYTLPDDGTVVYLSSTGTLTSNDPASASTGPTKAYASLNDAMTALYSTGGYIVVVGTYATGRGVTFGAKDYDKMITIRGLNNESVFKARHMCAARGPLTFEDIIIDWTKMTEGKEDDDYSIDMRNNKDGDDYKKTNPIVIGENISFVSTSEVLTLTGNDITINSGDKLSARLAETKQTATYNFPVNITLNGGTLRGIVANNDQVYVTTVKGDLNLNFNGGTFGGAGITVAGRLIVDGDYTVTVKGNTVFTAGLAPVKWHSKAAFESSEAGFVPSSYTITGVAAIDALEYTGSTLKIDESAWDALYINPIEVSDTLTLDASNINEVAATYVGTTDNAKVIINGDVTLKAATAFKNITIVNGENGRIIANGQKLAIADDVDTAANETTEKYIDIVTGSVGGTAVKATVSIGGGTYNSIVNNGIPGSKYVRGNEVVTVINDYALNALQISEGEYEQMDVALSDFTDGLQVGKYTPTEEEDGVNVVTYTLGRKVDTSILEYVKLDYYLNVEADDENNAVGTKPYIMLGNTKVEAEQALAAGWNYLNFKISGNGEINSFKLYPYGDADAVYEHNKMYVSGITFSLFMDTSAIAYSNPKWMAGNGDFVPDLEDYTLTSDKLTVTDGLAPTGLSVEQTPFTNGISAMISPNTGDTGVMLKYRLTDELGEYKNIRADFMPYVRVEYYVNAKDGDNCIGKYPTIKIPGYHFAFTAEQPIKDGWNVANFNIFAAERAFVTFEFNPYGDATLNEWNRMYIASLTFSQTENKATPAYANPDMNKDTGKVNPYIFDPASLTNIPEKYAYLKELPVVYYSDTGVYAGDAAGSVSSLTAYGDINKAIAALEAVGGGYIILTTDLAMNGYAPTNTYNPSKLPRQNNSISTHKNMIILRGIAAEKTAYSEMVSVGVGKVIEFNGPVWLQNVYFEAIGTSTGDEGLVSEELHYGTPGAGYSDVITRKGTWQTRKSNPGIGSSKDGGSPKKVDVSIHSGTFSGVLKLGGYYSGMNNSGNMYVNIDGGDLTGMSWATNHQNTHTTEGSAYITISGGKFKNAICFAGVLGKMSSPVYIKGDLNVTITGGDFSAMAANSITAKKYEDGVSDGVYGTRTIDILSYEGDSFEKLRAAINDNYFDVLNVNSIYVDGENGNDSNDGLTTSAPVKTLAKALEVIDEGECENAKYSGKIVFIGNYSIDEAEQVPAHETSITFNSQGSGKLILNAPLTLGGDSVFKNISIEVSDEGALVANGNALLMDSGITVTGDLDIIGGVADGTVDSVNITINSGTYSDIVAGDSVEGNVNITINGGTITGSVVGGSDSADGEIGGSILISINGGEFRNNATVVATGTAEGSKVSGGAEVNITGGDFSGLNQIQPGNSEAVGKIAVDYSKAPANVLNQLSGNKVASTFDVTVAPKMEAPVLTKKDKFIFIIKNVGDPTKALTKTIPFKVTQSAAQTHAPVVVSPAQLKLPINGGDNAILTIQPVNNVNTLRVTPNHKGTTGSIRVDGYNIKGRGVNSGKHKYAEIVYYYTVPEGQTPVAKKMSMNFYGAHSGVGASFSTEFVPNKWATVIIDLTAAFAKVDPADVTQYHLGLMCNEKGASLKGTDVPSNQYLDIVNMTFYSDMPKTTIVGGNAPSADVPEENEAAGSAAPVAVEDINVKLSQIKSAVNGVDSFTATEKMFEGLPAVEYIPNRSYNGVISIEGYGTTGKTVSSLDYQYVILKMYLKTETSAEYTPVVATQTGGLTNDPNPVKAVSYSAEKPLVPNQWNTVVVRITPANTDNRNFRQVHIRPFGGSTKNETLAEGDAIYIAEMIYSAKPPKAAKPAGSADEEIVEVEAEIIAESPAVVVGPEKLISSATDVKTFKSTLGEFDGKKIVMIKPNKVEQPLTIDGAAIFGETEQTPGGALSLETHRYAVISYYYATSDAETTKAPEFDLLGGRIQNMENVINGVTAKGEALKVNQWATAVVKLTGNGAGKLTSGFNLRPFGETSANSIASGDVLYIENITFVSNRP